MRKGPVTNHLREIWIAYSRKLLAGDPELRGRYCPKEAMTPNYFIYKGNRVVMSYKIFRQAVETFFDLAKERICQGDTLVLKGRLGNIKARRVERNHAKPTVNFGRTAAQPKVWNEEKQKEVPKKIIYFTDDDWCRVGWHKGKYPSASMIVYEFRPTKDLKSGKGFNQMLGKALKERPSLKFKFIYYPLKHKSNVV
jgi:hypothetical protein